MNELQVGARITLRVDRLSLGGDAVGRAGDVVVFVPYGAPGDTLEVEFTEVRPRFARARLLRVLEASPVRQEPPCPYHFRTEVRGLRTEEKVPLNTQSSALSPRLFCGGCSFQHMNYDFQLDAKRQLVQETLERIGKLEDIEVKPTLGMSEPWRYRNKVQQPVGWDGKKLISGFYAPFSHEIVPIEDCLIQSKLSVGILNLARALLERFHLRAYDEDRHTGWIRHFWVRTNQAGQALLVFVTRAAEFPHQAEIMSTLVREFPQLAGVYQNVNPGRTNVILGRQWLRCAGAEYIEERLGPLRFQLSPGSFFQVNTLQTEVLYNQVRAMAGQGDTLLDLYGGVGGIALWLAASFREVIGVDEVRSAAHDAEKNASINGIKNAKFVTAQVERFIAGYRGQPGKVVVVLDPPRSGCTPGVLLALARLKPANLIYVSCDPGTLARDLSALSGSGFRVHEIQPVDLFPHTPHIETVVRLSAPR